MWDKTRTGIFWFNEMEIWSYVNWQGNYLTEYLLHLFCTCVDSTFLRVSLLLKLLPRWAPSDRPVVIRFGRKLTALCRYVCMCIIVLYVCMCICDSIRGMYSNVPKRGSSVSCPFMARLGLCRPPPGRQENYSIIKTRVFCFYGNDA